LFVLTNPCPPVNRGLALPPGSATSSASRFAPVRSHGKKSSNQRKKASH
jgi:hypothetical protein